MADYPVTPLTPPLTEQEIIRRQKLQKLIDAGENPYEITRFDVTHRSAAILAGFEELEGREVSIAGRMTSRRVMGKASFAHLLDGEGDIQIYVRRDDVGEESYAAFKQDDIADNTFYNIAGQRVANPTHGLYIRNGKKIYIK